MHDNVHGFYKSYYADGTIRYEAEYENGRLNGKMKKFSKKGRILEEVTYVFGVKHGKAQYYNKDSEFLYALIFKDDVVVKVE
jgi:antitoxin component YwqK of YwqJK toxin-antitoxin module